MAQLVGSSLVQAFSFVGAQWLFAQFNHKGYTAEIKRHNVAIEQLTATREKFFEKETKRKDRIQMLEEQKRNANKDFAQINDLFEELKQLKQEQKVAKVPTLSDYYKPSSEMKHYQNVATGIIGLARQLPVLQWLIFYKT